MKVAVFGCLHGMLNAMYDQVSKYEKSNKEIIDFILVCGDCQTLRHEDDLQSIAMPDKYKKLGDFPDYYRGDKKIPKLTIFVGGNHEASNYLMTLPYGGWVCDNCYYLGYSSVIRYKGLRIAGISGIFNYHSSRMGRYEKLPFNESSKRSIYHVRTLDVFRLELLKSNIDIDDIDIFLSHDWPAKIYEHGDRNRLAKIKPWFKQEMNSRQGLGNPLTQRLVDTLRPTHWFAAHLHCKFIAKVNHKEKNKVTNFLSLDKIGPGKSFMDVLQIEPNRDYDKNDDNLYYDCEWIAILKKTLDLESSSERKSSLLSLDGQVDITRYHIPTKEDIKLIEETIIQKANSLRIPKNFIMSEPIIYNRPDNLPTNCDPLQENNFSNPQTEEFMELVELKSGKQKTKQPMISESDGEDLFEEIERPRKKQAQLPKQAASSEDDGCLPFYIDKSGDS